MFRPKCWLISSAVVKRSFTKFPNRLIKSFNENEANLVPTAANSAGEHGKVKVHPQKRSLFSVNIGHNTTGEGRQHIMYEGLSPEMQVFTRYLYNEGYLNDSKFPKSTKSAVNSCDQRFERDLLNFGIETFGKEHREVGRWLSGKDLRIVAQFGCPSPTRKVVFSAKRVRRFLQIKEDSVCRNCPVKQMCKFANQSVWNCDTKNLSVTDTLCVLSSYALGEVHPRFHLSEDVRISVVRLLKQITSLSQLSS